MLGCPGDVLRRLVEPTGFHSQVIEEVDELAVTAADHEHSRAHADLM